MPKIICSQIKNKRSKTALFPLIFAFNLAILQICHVHCAGAYNIRTFLHTIFCMDCLSSLMFHHPLYPQVFSSSSVGLCRDSCICSYAGQFLDVPFSLSLCHVMESGSTHKLYSGYTGVTIQRIGHTYSTVQNHQNPLNE